MYGDIALRINPTIYCINFYFLKQYIVYKSFSATAHYLITLIESNFYNLINLH